MCPNLLGIVTIKIPSTLAVIIMYYDLHFHQEQYTRLDLEAKFVLARERRGEVSFSYLRFNPWATTRYADKPLHEACLGKQNLSRKAEN